MKVVAINGSARQDGNTALLVREVFAELGKAGFETELVQLAGKKLAGCAACYRCFDNKDRRCAVSDDDMNPIIEKLAGADGIILASPTYFADCSAGLKAVIERAGFVGRANPGLFRRKAGAAVVAVRRGGAIHAFDTINHFFLINEMIVAGSVYWNDGLGRNPGEVEKDEEGMKTMAALGQNLAWLLGKLK
ncbi:MAG: flavodoxin family protein [Candidatus Saganbacteria bacterium]|nr:flavodoxin family protein [Candidatus Saganbacteria bacterium]